MRLFVAIELPREIRSILSGLHADIPGIRWVPPEQLHLTLHFLGEVAPEQLEPLCAALAAIAGSTFTLRLDHTGCFTRGTAPRILWVGVAQQPALQQLTAQIGRAIETCGIVLENRPFFPHITVGRVINHTSCDVTGFVQTQLRDRMPPVVVQQFILFQSRLTAHGAIHEAVRTFPLPADCRLS